MDKKGFSCLNFVSDLIRWIVSTQDVDSVSHAHCSGVEAGTLEWPFTLPYRGLWTKTVYLYGKKTHLLFKHLQLEKLAIYKPIYWFHTSNSFMHLLTHLVSGQVTEVQCVADWHRLDKRSMEELAELCDQAVPLVHLCVVAEETVQRGVKGVCDLHLWSKSVDDTATGTGLRVEDGSGQLADWAPGLGQRVIILHLRCRKENRLCCT